MIFLDILFYHIMYQTWWFLLLLFIHTFVLYRGIFSKKNRLYLSALVQHWNCSRSFLASEKKWRKLSFSYFTTGHSFPLCSTYFLPKHSQLWPRADFCCTVFPFLILEPQCWSSRAPWNWLCILSGALIQMLKTFLPTEPMQSCVVIPVLSRQVCELKEDTAFGWTVLVFHSIPGGGEREMMY